MLYLSRPWTRDPSASIRSNQSLMDEARYLPHRPPLVAHTVCKELAGINWEYLRGFVLCCALGLVEAVMTGRITAHGTGEVTRWSCVSGRLG